MAGTSFFPIRDVILESLLRVDLGFDEREFISALVSLWGEQMAVARLVEGSREKCWCVGTLNLELVSQLKIGELSETVMAEIEGLGIRENLRVDVTDIDGGTSLWTLSPSSWGSFRPRYQLRLSQGRLEFYDCNVAGRAFSAIAQIPGKASFTELQCAIEHADSNLTEIAIRSLAERDSTESVRTAAAGALGKLKSEVVKRSMVDALADNAVEIQVAAGEALVRIEAPELSGRVAETMLQIAKADQAQDLRRRAGHVLSAIPNGVEPLHAPIQAELVRGQAETALQLIAATLEILPADVDLFWWRGHALRLLGRLNEAAESFQHAFELEKQASVIPQAIAQTLLDLRDYPRASEAARQAVEIAPGDANAQSVLAWSSYNSGTIQDALKAASKAVDLDPIHNSAIWVVLLGHIRQANLEESRSAFQHALRMRQLLSPDLDTSFVTTFLEELQGIKSDNAEISRLMEEIKSALI